MRAEELDVRGKSAVSDRSTTNGESCPPLWTNESILHETAPRALRKAFAAGDQDEGWKAWRRHLQRRKRPISPTRIYPGGSMLAWGLPIEPSPELGWLLKQLGPGRDRRRAAREKLAELAEQWRGEKSSHDHPLIANGSDHIEQSNGNAGHSNGQLIHPHHLAHAPLTTHGSTELAEVHSPLTCLAWLHLLVIRPELFSAELWWQVCSRLLEVAQETGRSPRKRSARSSALGRRAAVDACRVAPGTQPLPRLTRSGHGGSHAGHRRDSGWRGFAAQPLSGRVSAARRMLVALSPHCRTLRWRLLERSGRSPIPARPSRSRAAQLR